MSQARIPKKRMNDPFLPFLQGEKKKFIASRKNARRILRKKIIDIIAREDADNFLPSVRWELRLFDLIDTWACTVFDIVIQYKKIDSKNFIQQISGEAICIYNDYAKAIPFDKIYKVLQERLKEIKQGKSQLFTEPFLVLLIKKCLTELKEINKMAKIFNGVEELLKNTKSHTVQISKHNFLSAPKTAANVEFKKEKKVRFVKGA